MAQIKQNNKNSELFMKISAKKNNSLFIIFDILNNCSLPCYDKAVRNDNTI